MKTYLNIILFLAGIQLINAQVQDGTLDINGSPNFAQSITTMEAGLDDVELISSNTDPLVSFILNPTTNPLTGVTISSELNCETVYLYKVFSYFSLRMVGIRKPWRKE